MYTLNEAFQKLIRLKISVVIFKLFRNYMFLKSFTLDRNSKFFKHIEIFYRWKNNFYVFLKILKNLFLYVLVI